MKFTAAWIVQENEAPAFTHGRLRTFSDSKPTGMNGLVDGTPMGFDTGGLWQHLRQHPSFEQASAFAALTSNGNVNIRNTDHSSLIAWDLFAFLHWLLRF
jgi:hypothetical protein